MSARHINKVKKANPHLETLNAYGPTENTTFSTYYKMEGWQQEPVPIGKPIANSTIYILNKSFNLLPVGMEGEIFVGGLGVARGYLNDKKLSTQKFIPDPFRPGGRLYRTGDMGKWLESGDVAFTGRKDKQVKIRGHRIETFEIEDAFNSHPSIEKTIVLTEEMPDGRKCLVAFYTGAPLPAAEWRSLVGKRLPEYMIPARAVHVSEFPLTSNGKANKAKLLALSQTSVGTREEEEPPQTAAEKKVAEIWGEVLGSRNPGVSDNFFHQGGNSLLAVKLISRIKKEFDIKGGMPVSVLFEQPTIKDLAGLISNDRYVTGSYLVSIQPRGNKAPLFLIPGYLFYHNLSRHLGNDQPVFGFEPIPNKTTTETAAHYIRLLQAIQPQGPYFIGGYCAGGIVAYEMAQQLSAAGHEIGMLALFETYTQEGVVSKVSYRYLQQKIQSVTSSLVSSSFDEKLKIMRKESGRAINYIMYRFKKIANKEYTIKPFTGKLALYKAMDGMIGSANDPYMGWKKYCSDENLEVFQVPGNHDTMFKEPHVETLACVLKEQMGKAVYSKAEYEWN